ncbi:hypothetical protein Tco_0072343 [Tanacetum coccineum]
MVFNHHVSQNKKEVDSTMRVGSGGDVMIPPKDSVDQELLATGKGLHKSITFLDTPLLEFTPPWVCDENSL